MLYFMQTFSTPRCPLFSRPVSSRAKTTGSEGKEGSLKTASEMHKCRVKHQRQLFSILSMVLLISAACNSGCSKPNPDAAKRFAAMTACVYDYDGVQDFLSGAGCDRGLASMLRRNARGTRLYLYCGENEKANILSVDATGAVNKIECPAEPFSSLVLDTEERIVAWYNSSSEVLTIQNTNSRLDNIISFEFDRSGKYFAYAAGNQPETIRVSAFSEPEKVLVSTKHIGAFDIFSSDSYVFLAVAGGCAKPLLLLRYKIGPDALTLVEERPIWHPKSRSLLRPGLFIRDMDVEAEVLFCRLDYDDVLGGLSRLYLYDVETQEFALFGPIESHAFFLQQCIPLGK